MYVSNRGVSNWFWIISSLSMGLQKAYYAIKNKALHFLCRKINLPTTAKYKTSSLSLPIHQSTYAWKNISSYFFCRSTGSLHTCDEGFFNTPHFYKGIQKHFYHQNFSPFTNCLQTKKKHLSLLLPIQKHFDHLKISPFTIYLHSNLTKNSSEAVLKVVLVIGRLHPKSPWFIRDFCTFTT